MAATAPRARSVKRNDTVLVLAGKSKGRTGRVLRGFPAEGRATAEGGNFGRKHTKANPQKNIKGGILEREPPADLSNLMPVCREGGKPTPARHKFLEAGNKAPDS